MQIYKFRNCLLNTAERSVLKDGTFLEMTSKTFDVLQYLVERAGEVVTKDEILGHVWSGNFVEEGNLPVHISKIRRHLGENKQHRFIETVSALGYRFVAPVEKITDALWEEYLESGKTIDASRKRYSKRDSIAVLPLRNETNDSTNDYLSDGITESLIDSLSQIPGVRVIARDTVFRYKKIPFDVRDVSAELGVGRVLVGYLGSKKNNEELTVSLELIDCENMSRLWGKCYANPVVEIASMQASVLTGVSAKLRADGLAAFREPLSASGESYKLYLMGKYLLGKRTKPETERAIGFFERSIRSNHTNVYSHVAIADAYHYLYVLEFISLSEVLLRLKPLLATLSQLDQNIDVVQVLLGRLKLHLDWKVEASAECFRNALLLNPNSVDARRMYAEAMIVLGDEECAVEQTREVLALDPMSIVTLKDVARIFYKLGRFEESIAHLHDAYEMEPRDFETLLLLGAAYAEMDRFEEAMTFLQLAHEAQPSTETLSMIGYVEALAGNMGRAESTMQTLKTEYGGSRSIHVNLARIHLALGNKDAAYKLLENALKERSLEMYALSHDPRWKSIRGEPRFTTLVHRVMHIEPTFT